MSRPVGGAASGAASGPANSDGVDWRSAYLALEEQVETMLLAMSTVAAEPPPPPPVVLHSVKVGAHPQGLRGVAIADGVDLEYSFVVTRDATAVLQVPYGRSNTVIFPVTGAGAYRVKATVRRVGHPRSAVSRTSGPARMEGK